MLASDKMREPAGFEASEESARILSLLVLCSDDLTLVVRSARLANSVRHHKRATFAAFYKRRCCHLPLCTTAVSSCSGMLILRTNSSHLLTPPVGILILLPPSVFHRRNNDYMPTYILCQQKYLHILHKFNGLLGDGQFFVGRYNKNLYL